MPWPLGPGPQPQPAFFPQCLASATEGVRLAARIVDTPCNEMNTDTFLEVRGPGGRARGGTRMGRGLIDPKEGRGKPEAGGGRSSQCLHLPGAAWGCCQHILAPHSAARGLRAWAKGGGRTGPSSKAPLRDSSHELQEIAELGGRASLLFWV